MIIIITIKEYTYNTNKINKINKTVVSFVDSLYLYLNLIAIGHKVTHFLMLNNY